jgi:hypothetical protein
VNKHAHECPLLATSLKLVSLTPFAGAGHVKATRRRGGVAVSHILGGLRQAFDDDSLASSPQRPATMGEQHGAVRVVPIVKHVLEMHRVEAARSILEDIAGNEGGPVRKVGF